MKKEFLISVLAAGMLTMTGCGSSSDDSGTTGGDTTTTLSAQFIDSEVQGISYDCQTSGKSGLTDSEGRFNYVAGDTCTFKVGTVTLGSAQPTGPIFTPRDLADDPELTNILRFLQTLDSDGDTSNGITLPSDLNGTVSFGTDFNTTMDDFITTNYEIGSEPVVVTPDEANTHFQDSISITLTEAMFSGKLYSYTDTAVRTQFFADYTFIELNSAQNCHGTWNVLDKKLTLDSTCDDGTSAEEFYLETTPAVDAVITGENGTRTIASINDIIILTPEMFNSMTYTYGESPNKSTTSYASDGTFSSPHDSPQWTITDNKLVMTDSEGTTIITLITDSISHGIAYDNGQEPNDFGEGVYTVTETVSTPPPETIILTDDMFIGRTYTFSMEGSEDVVMDFYGDYTVRANGDGSVNQMGEWSIVENKLVIGTTTTIEFTGDTTAIINADNTVDGQMTYTSIVTPTGEDTVAKSGEPLRAEVRRADDNSLLSTIDYTYNDNVATETTTVDENNSNVITSTYQSNNRVYRLEQLTSYNYSYPNGDGTYYTGSYTFSLNRVYSTNNDLVRFYTIFNNTLSQDINLTYNSEGHLDNIYGYSYEDNTSILSTVLSYDLHGNFTEFNSIEYDENGTETSNENSIITYVYYASGNLQSENIIDQNTGNTTLTTYLDVNLPFSRRMWDFADEFVLTSTWDETGDGILEDSEKYTYDAQNRKISYFDDENNNNICDEYEECTTYFYE